jgi:hypothetical protein
MTHGLIAGELSKKFGTTAYRAARVLPSVVARSSGRPQSSIILIAVASP